MITPSQRTAASYAICITLMKSKNFAADYIAFRFESDLYFHDIHITLLLISLHTMWSSSALHIGLFFHPETKSYWCSSSNFISNKIHENTQMFNTFTVVNTQNFHMNCVSGCQKKPRLIELAAARCEGSWMQWRMYKSANFCHLYRSIIAIEKCMYHDYIVGIITLRPLYGQSFDFQQMLVKFLRNSFLCFKYR